MRNPSFGTVVPGIEKEGAIGDIVERVLTYVSFVN